MYKYIGENRDIPAPDMGSNAQVMDWMTDAYQKRHSPITMRYLPENLSGAAVQRDEPKQPVMG